AARPGRARSRPARCGRPLRWTVEPARRARAGPGRGVFRVGRPARGGRGRGLSGLVGAGPAEGGVRRNAQAVVARAGLTLLQPRGARDYRGTIAEIDNVEIAYLSAAEITAQLALGAAHLGVTGEDLVREMMPDAAARVVMIEKLGFGHADVV